MAESDQLSRDLASLKIDRSPAAPRRPIALRLGIIAAIVGAIALVGWKYVYPKITSALDEPELEIGEVQLISPAQGQTQLTATGYVIALTSAKVAAKVPGRIKELFVDEGDTVKAGDKIATLEDVDIKAALAASKARAAAAYAKIQIARAQLAEVKAQVDREKPLVESGVDAKAVLTDLLTRSDSLAAAVRSAESDAAAAEADTASLNTQFGSYLITTPINGVVVSKLVQVGEGVSPGFGTPGVVEVVDMASLVVEVDVPEARLSQVSEDPPTPCEVILDAFPQKRYRCQVKTVGHRVNRSKATVPVRVKFLDDFKGVLPEMAARVSFLSQQLDANAMKAPPRLMVPAAAVVQRGGADVVFVYDEGNVRMQSVKVGPPIGDLREMQSDLPAGTRVVLSPPADLTDGKKVKEKKS